MLKKGKKINLINDNKGREWKKIWVKSVPVDGTIDSDLLKSLSNTLSSMKKEKSNVKVEDINFSQYDRGRQTFRNKYVPLNRYQGFWKASRPAYRSHSGARSQSSGGGAFQPSSQYKYYFRE